MCHLAQKLVPAIVCPATFHLFGLVSPGLVWTVHDTPQASNYYHLHCASGVNRGKLPSNLNFCDIPCQSSHFQLETTCWDPSSNPHEP
jgi:hypothetical protein